MNKLLIVLIIVPSIAFGMDDNKDDRTVQERQDAHREYLWDRVIAAHEWGLETPALEELKSDLKSRIDSCSNQADTQPKTILPAAQVNKQNSGYMALLKKFSKRNIKLR